MVALDPIVLATIVALPVSLISFAVFRASRSARRNREDRCGNCGGPLYAPGALAGPSLLQGHLICEPCAAKERRSLRRGLIAAITIAAVTILALAAVALWAPSQLGSHPWVPVAAASLEYPALFAGAIAWMKRANRRAAHRLGLQRDLSLEGSHDSTLALKAAGMATYRAGRADA
jgi:membrane protein implicated in regulation of membrane protease activity